MVSLTSSPRSSLWLALLCAIIVVVAWIAPLLADVLQGNLEDWPLNSSQETAVPAHSHAHIEDSLDEPMILTSLDVTARPTSLFPFLPMQPTAWTWSPLPPIRPPIILNSI